MQKLLLLSVLVIFPFLLETGGFCYNIGPRIQNSSGIQEESMQDLYEKTMICREYLKKGMTSDCLNLCRITIDKYSSFPGAGKYFGYLNSYMAQCYMRIGKLDLARAIFELTDLYSRQVGDKSLELSNKINLSIFEIDCQNYEESKRILVDLLDFTDIESFYSQKEVILNNLALTSISLQEYDQAQYYFNSLFKILEEKTISGELDIPLLFRNYGNLMQRSGDVNIAIEYYNKSLKLYSKDYSETHFQVGNTYRYLAEAYLEADSLIKAHYCFNKSLKILWGKPADGIELINETPVAYETVLLQAITSYSSFVNTIIPDMENIPAIEIAEDLCSLIHEAENRINSFVRTQPPGSPVFILTNKVRPLFDAGIEVALFLYDKTDDMSWLRQSFDWSVRSKSYSLKVQAEKEKMIQNHPELSAVLSKQKELLNILNSIEDWKEDDPSSIVIDEMEGLIDNYESYNDTITKIYDNLDKQGIFSNDSKENLVKESRHWNQDLLSYHICLGKTYAFYLSKGKLYVTSIDISEDIIKDVDSFKKILYSARNAYYTGIEIEEFDNIGNRLYNRILSPVIKRPKSNSIIIQPDGILQGLPFELFIERTQAEYSGDLTFRDLNYLIKENDISYWMGLDDEDTRLKSSGKDIILVACSTNADGSKMIQEVDKIKELSGSYTDVRLVQDPFNYKELQKYHLIHFASHYIINDQEPLISGLVCSMDSYDPYITLNDILSIDILDSHVFINGCNTGQGKLNPGQGLMSLGLVFGISGAEEIICNLWKAEDVLSENIAINFYKKGVPDNYAKRLTNVKKDYLKRATVGYDHPHFWGGLVYSGKPSKPINKGISILVLIILIPGFVMIYRFARGKD